MDTGTQPTQGKYNFPL